MGLVIMKRSHLKRKTDLFKLRLLFQNRLPRRMVRVSQALLMRFLGVAREGVGVPREEALGTMLEPAVNGGSLCTTAPQLGRMCKQLGRPDLAPLCHTGPGRGKELQILADLIGGCGAARAYIAVQPDGRITPCAYMPDVAIGHVSENTLLDIWHNSDLPQSLAERGHLKGNCGRCEYNAIRGGRRARAWAYLGDFKAPDPGCINNTAYHEQTRLGFETAVPRIA